MTDVVDAASDLPLPSTVPPRILVVEDHDPTRLLRAKVLRHAGFRVTLVATAAAAMVVALTGRRRPAAVLLDVSVSDLDGFTACERIKTLMPTVPVIMITAVYRTARARRDGFAAGADAYLLEPTPPAVLVRTIRRLLDGHTSASEAECALLITTADGWIVTADRAAAGLLNLTPRGLTGRPLPLFFQDRAAVTKGLELARAGQVFDAVLVLRPRERRAMTVYVDVSVPSDGVDTSLQWRLTPLV